MDTRVNTKQMNLPNNHHHHTNPTLEVKPNIEWSNTTTKKIKINIGKIEKEH